MYKVSQLYSSSGGAEDGSAAGALVDRTPSIMFESITGASASAIADCYFQREGCCVLLSDGLVKLSAHKIQRKGWESQIHDTTSIYPKLEEGRDLSDRKSDTVNSEGQEELDPSEVY